MTGTWILGIAGLIFSIGAALCIYQAVRAQRQVHAMMAAETLTVPELEQLRGIAGELGARFQKVAEVVGAAAPGPHGLLRAEMSGTESVWHAQRVQRHFEHTETDSDGDRRTSRRTETVAQTISGPAFTLVRDGHTILVDHGGRMIDDAERVVDRFEQSSGGGGGGFRRAVATLVDADRDTTIGYQYSEWVVRPGTPLYVLGEVHDRLGALVVGPPADRAQHFVVSTRSEEELTADTRRHQRLMARIGAGAGALGVLLLTLAVVAL